MHGRCSEAPARSALPVPVAAAPLLPEPRRVGTPRHRPPRSPQGPTGSAPPGTGTGRPGAASRLISPRSLLTGWERPGSARLAPLPAGARAARPCSGTGSAVRCGGAGAAAGAAASAAPLKQCKRRRARPRATTAVPDVTARAANGSRSDAHERGGAHRSHAHSAEGRGSHKGAAPAAPRQRSPEWQRSAPSDETPPGNSPFSNFGALATLGRFCPKTRGKKKCTNVPQNAAPGIGGGSGPRSRLTGHPRSPSAGGSGPSPGRGGSGGRV